MSDQPTSDTASHDSGNDSHASGASNYARETAHRAAAGAMEIGQDAANHYVQEPAKDLISLAKAYAKDHPDVAVCWAFGLGIFVGWKMKP